MISITSEENFLYKRWVDLSSSRGIKKHNEFILMGDKLIHEFLSHPNYPIVCEITTHKHSPLTSAKQFQLSPELFNNVDVIGTHYNLLVLETRPIAEYSSENQSGLELICPLGDPTNLGSVIRSAVAFGVSKIILTSEACYPYHPKAIKASSGSILHAPLFKASHLNTFLTNTSDIYALDMDGEDIGHFQWPGHIKLLVGEEGPGIHSQHSLKKIKIPIKNVESLNATIAASIAMYLFSTRNKFP